MQEQQQQQRNQYGDSSNPQVQLHAKARDEGGKIEWSLSFDNPPPKGSKAEVKLGKGSGGHDIVFHISPTEGLDITFDGKNPIIVSEGKECPPPPGSTSDQIEVIDIKPKKLTIHDCNTRECDLTYQLQFIGADPLDPMIRNGGR